MANETQRVAQLALAQRLRSLLPKEITDQFVGGTHTRRFADNLLPSFSADRVREVREQLSRGAGGELKPTASGKRRAHAPYSSAALAANAFGSWLGAERELPVAGLSDFESRISLEHKLKIAYGGGEANLDCALQTATSLVGIESKLTEPLAEHDPVEWRSPYQDPQMETLLQGGWRKVFEASLRGEWTPSHLGLEQLIKHALALNSHANTRTTHLVYLYWEPVNGDRIPEITAHRAEVAQLLEMVRGCEPTLSALTYEELFAEWSDLTSPGDRRSEHLRHLQNRYSDISF